MQADWLMNKEAEMEAIFTSFGSTLVSCELPCKTSNPGAWGRPISQHIHRCWVRDLYALEESPKGQENEAKKMSTGQFYN